LLHDEVCSIYQVVLFVFFSCFFNKPKYHQAQKKSRNTGQQDRKKIIEIRNQRIHHCLFDYGLFDFSFISGLEIFRHLRLLNFKTATNTALTTYIKKLQGIGA